MASKKITPYCTASELEAENAAKDQKIKKLEQENASIKARLDKIEKAFNSK